MTKDSTDTYYSKIFGKIINQFFFEENGGNISIGNYLRKIAPLPLLPESPDYTVEQPLIL